MKWWGLVIKCEERDSKYIPHAEGSSKMFGLPYYHYHQVYITYKYAGIYTSV